VVDAAVSGIRAFIDPSGRVVSDVGLFRTAILRHTIRSSDVVTPYVRWGDWFPWLSLVIVAGMGLVPRKRTGVRGAPEPLSRIDADVGRPATYEERHIEWVLARLLTFRSVDVLVVDDSSPDGTGRLVQAVSEDEPGYGCSSVRGNQGCESIPGRLPSRC
jgi:hypothetical protein